MKASIRIYIVCGLLILSSFLTVQAQSIDNYESSSRFALESWLKEINGIDDTNVTYIPHTELQNHLLSHIFFALHFQSYPVAREAPAPLQTNNIFAVSQDKEITHITSLKELEMFFKGNLIAINDKILAYKAMNAWMSLMPELDNDGFYLFSDPSISVSQNNDSLTVEGSRLIIQGGTGEVSAHMSFNKSGKLTDMINERNVKSGIRPICQATKLLDKDPIVRKMAEQDILVMGRSAHDYLSKQRLKAKKPLQLEIDRIWNRIIAEGR